MWTNPRVWAAVDCRERDGEDVREEIVGGNACGGKPGSHRSNPMAIHGARSLLPVLAL